MTANEFSVILDEVLAELKIDVGLDVEKNLFREAMLLQVVQLNRVPTSFQIKQSWFRWKLERGLDKDVERPVDLYKHKK